MRLVPAAWAVIRSMNSWTTLKLTSASSSAVRTSRRPSFMFASVRMPLTRKRRKAVDSRFWRSSNMTDRAQLTEYCEPTNIPMGPDDGNASSCDDILAKRLQPGEEGLGVAVGPEQAGVGIDVRQQVAGVMPGHRPYKRLGQPQRQPPSRPGGLCGLVGRGRPLCDVDLDRRVGAVCRGHCHDQVQRHVQERVEIEQPGELEEIAEMAAGAGEPRRDLDADAGDSQVGAQQVIAQVQRPELEVAGAHPFRPRPIDVDAELRGGVGLASRLDRPRGDPDLLFLR